MRNPDPLPAHQSISNNNHHTNSSSSSSSNTSRHRGPLSISLSHAAVSLCCSSCLPSLPFALQRVLPPPLDLGRAFDELKAVSKLLESSGSESSGSGSSGSGSCCDKLDNYMSHGHFLRAMEHLGWWSEELNATDKKEAALAISLADQIAHPKQKLAARRVLPQGTTKRGFILAFEYLPFNLPEWPVSSPLPPPSSSCWTRASCSCLFAVSYCVP